MSIQLLDAVTVGQIAAGEIVERPVSVVKELVENALDAGAMRIVVNVEGGGLDLIEVIDDGAGIEAGDLPLALRRHATSKLREAADLEAIGTLGFRGEGLASIAAVARVEVLARTANASIGSRILAHGDVVGSVEPAPAPVGTRVRAEKLFENVPVRREYVRGANAEFNRIATWLTSLALAYPRVTFVLRHDGKEVRALPASDDPRERLAMVFGRDAAAGLIALDGASAPLAGSLRGFISLPGKDRGDRRMQVLFVNGRLLRSTLLAGAWTAGYATYAMIGRHPYGVLMLDLPPDHVDPNVHPTKSDVRLRFGKQVFDATRHAIGATLAAQASARLREHLGASEGAISFAPAAFARDRESVAARVESPLRNGATTGESAPVASLFDDASEAEAPAALRLKVLGQLDRTYILASDERSLLLVDQHAAHERIAYETIVARARDDAPSEPLLVPLTLELDAAQSAMLDRTLDLLREGGLEIEPFGERTYRIVATPAGYGARAFDVAGFLDDLGAEGKQRDVRERLWASLACHSVTVAGERLEHAEMTTLIERLQRCANPMHCPHGRPTMVRLEPVDVARLFKRI